MQFKTDNPGLFLKEKRKANGFTLKTLSEFTDLSSGYLSRIENGSSSPSLEAIYKLSRYLAFDINDLCEFKKIELNHDEPISLIDMFRNLSVKIDDDILTDYQKVQMTKLLEKIHRMNWDDELNKMGNITEILLLIEEFKRGK